MNIKEGLVALALSVLIVLLAYLAYACGRPSQDSYVLPKSDWKCVEHEHPQQRQACVAYRYDPDHLQEASK